MDIPKDIKYGFNIEQDIKYGFNIEITLFGKVVASQTEQTMLGKIVASYNNAYAELSISRNLKPGDDARASRLGMAFILLRLADNFLMAATITEPIGPSGPTGVEPGDTDG